MVSNQTKIYFSFQICFKTITSEVVLFPRVDKHCSSCSGRRSSPQKTAHTTAAVTRLLWLTSGIKQSSKDS